MKDPVLTKIRESRGRVRNLDRALNAEYVVRRKLYVQARAKGIPLRLIAQAAGVSESAVSLALRPDRDVPLRESGT